MRALENKVQSTAYLLGIGLICSVIQSFNCQQMLCENRNPEGHTSKKTEGDGRFRIVVVGNYSSRGHYAPNDVYTVTIQGLKTRYSTQKFTEFLLVAESEKLQSMGQTELITTGIFHIIDDSHSRYSDTCSDGITNMNMQPKTEISVLWTAPSTLVASCITFRATVVERPHVWYQDDGQLTKVLCPEMPRRMRLPRINHVPGFEQNVSKKNEMLDRRRRNNKTMNAASVEQIPRASGTMIKPSPPTHIEEASRSSLAPRTTPPETVPSPAGPSTDSLSSTSSKCCACDEAKYEVRFEGIWSKETHPKDFPENEWLLHFSDIIGASHSPDYNVWKPGEVASEGIRQVAEWGATRHLETELKSKSRYINTIIKAKGLWHPDERGTTSAAFRVDKQHHLMSLVSMIGPSPDWIVGITSFELCLPNCTWREEADFDLYPYDAGTDSGITYMSPNTPTEPRQPIRALTSKDPNDSKSPFFEIDPMRPFARAIIRRQRIYPKHCNDTSRMPDEVYNIENSEDSSRPECSVTDWTPWSDCSVTCGKGLRMRKRSYLLPMKADMFRCDRQLVEKEMCLGAESACGFENVSAFEEFDSICAVTAWSDWTPCSVTCGKGTRSRSRRYKNHMGRKKCNLEMTQTEMCVVSLECAKTNSSEVEESCPMTPWSQWTPCSVTCGIGIRERTRFPLLVDERDIKEKCGSILTSQRATCTGEFGITCKLSRDEAREICSLPADVGSCRSNHTKYFFSVEKSMCVPFEWSGCKGNRNKFETVSECNEICGFLRSLWSHRFSETPTTPDSVPTPATTTTTPYLHTSNSVVGSLISPLTLEPSVFGSTETTEPPVSTLTTKALTFSNVFRTTFVPDNQAPQVDLSDADADDEITDEYKIVPQPATLLSVGDISGNKDLHGTSADCVVSRWSSWSECSATCGVGLKTRTRNVLIHPQNGGKLCPRLEKRKSCKLQPCEGAFTPSA